MNKLNSILGAVAIVAIIVVFILQFGPASGQPKVDSGPRCAVEVRGTCLSAGEFWASYRLIGGGVDPARSKALHLRKSVADGLVEQHLLVQDAKRLGLTVSDDDVTAEIAAGRAHVSLPATEVLDSSRYFGLVGDELVRVMGVRKTKGDKKKIDAKATEKDIRARTKLSSEEYREYQKNELIAARMRDIIRSRARIGENEAREQFLRDKSTATLEYARFDRRFYADLVVDWSQKAIDEYAARSKDELDKVWESRKGQILPECRTVREIYVRLDEQAGDEEKAAARKKMTRALERIKAGEDFGDVARAVSDDPSAIRGGELGCFPKGKAPKPLEEAVFATKAGEMTNIQENDNGLWLFKVEQVAKDADAEKLGRAWTAKEVYVAQEAERLAADGAKQVQTAIKGGKSVKDALDAYLADLAKTVEKRDADKGASKDDKKSDAKKGDDKKADEKKGDATDRPRVTLATHAGRPTVETTLPFNAGGDPIPGVKNGAELAKIAFGLEKAGDAPANVFPFDNGYLVLALKEKTPASDAQWAKDKEFYVSAMRAYKQNDALVGYMKRLTSTLGSEVKYTPSIVEEPKASDKDKSQGAPMPEGDDSGE